MDSPNPSEETALLRNGSKQKRRPTPLPKLQIWIVIILQLCEPITSQSIYPYINQLVSELDITGGDERKTGYYAGLIESLFFATEAITVLQWSRISDHIGRKPVLLIGLTGTMISMILFGLSRTFWTLIISRCLTGLLNGNIGVMKSLMGDLTDASNRAEGFALLPVTWSLGATVGPLLGGLLARPQDNFPSLFPGKFWADYPYFLPCLASTAVVFVISLIALAFLKETVPQKSVSKWSKGYGTVPHSESSDHPAPVPLRQLLTYPVVISVANYIALAFLNIAFGALFPLFLAMPIEIGGLNLPPSQIGYIIGGWGAFNGIFQFFYFAKIINTLGEWRVVRNGMLAFIPLFGLLPIVNYLARLHGGVSLVCGLLLGSIVIFATMMDLCFGAIFMYITSSAPNKSSLGATNGLSQTTVSIARAFGPAMSTSLFSLSVEKNYLGGNAVYVFFIGLTLLAMILVGRLPSRVWDAEDEDE